MVAARTSAVAALVAWIGMAAPCGAAPAADGAMTYVLTTPPSSLEIGCQGPCACPIVSFPTYGSFNLVETGSDPLYTYYAVERYIASFNNGPGAVAITGSGQYKIGGEFALVQELTLDLEIQGHPTQHFDSGLQPIGAPFPQIHVSCAVHGFACYDSVLFVDARRIGTVGVPSSPLPVAGLQAAQPNPFDQRTSIVFNLDHSAVVDLVVIDVSGRLVRALASGQLVGPGRQSVTWDGRCDDGRVAPAGVYWVSLRWPEGFDRRRIVKLDGRQ